MSHCDKKPVDGFTLIEVMVSLAIVGLIMMFMFSGLSVGMDTWERSSRKISEIEDRLRVEQLLRRQLGLAWPHEFVDDTGAFVLFSGDTANLEFVSQYSLIDGPIELRKIDYSIDEGRFAYREHFLFGYDPNEIYDDTSHLLASFEVAEFRYLGADQDGQPEWKQVWERGSGLPRAVEIRIDGDYLIVPLVYS